MDDAEFDKKLLERDRIAREAAVMLGPDSMEVKTSVGSLKANGSVVILVILILTCAAGVAFMVRDGDLRAQDRSAATDKKVDAVSQKLEEAVYVLTLDEKQRKDLKLDMPESLRKRTR